MCFVTFPINFSSNFSNGKPFTEKPKIETRIILLELSYFIQVDRARHEIIDFINFMSYIMKTQKWELLCTR